MRSLILATTIAGLAVSPAMAATADQMEAYAGSLATNFETRDFGSYFSSVSGEELMVVKVAEIGKRRDDAGSREKCDEEKKREAEAEKKRVGARPPQGPEPRYLAF